MIVDQFYFTQKSVSINPEFRQNKSLIALNKWIFIEHTNDMYKPSTKQTSLISTSFSVDTVVVVVGVLVVMVVVVVVVVVIVVVAVVSVVMMIETVFSIVVAVAFWNCVELTSTLAVVAVDSLKFTEVAVGLPVLMLLCFNSVVDLYIWKLKSREEFIDDERASDCDVAICCVAWATNDDSKLVAVGVVRSMVLVYVNVGSVSDEENPGELEIYVVVSVSVDGWFPSVMLLKCIVLVVVWKWKLIANVEQVCLTLGWSSVVFA